MKGPGFSNLWRAWAGTGTAAGWRGVLLASVAALALAGCNANDGVSPMSKANKSLSPQTLSLIQEKGMTKTSPLVVRIFKEESELEVWKETTGGEYALLKTYPICRWSGELGPKVKEGDRQAPEGFYAITPGQMNPNSSYYLSFDLGFPNAYDRAWGRSGSNLMVHGDCSSRGCYAMTDEQVQEIFALGRESFFGGQRSFQVQAYPFRMTADNMVRHRNNPNLAFWKMLKEGSDVFELTKAPPQVGYCGKRYVFNATPVDPNQKLQASLPCPDYTQPEGLAEALAARQRETDTRIASAGALQPAAPVKTGKDGGMHKVFIAKLENPELSAPGSLPAVVKPPGSDYGVATNEPAPAESIALATADTVTEANAATAVPVPAPRPADAPGGPRTTAVAAAPASSAPSPASSAASLFSFFGNSSSATPAAATATPATPAPTTQVASLDSGGFLDGLKNLFGGTTPPAQTPAAPPAADAAAGAAAEVPVPPVRQTPAPAAPAAAARPAPAASAATAPAPRANPAPAPQASTARPAPAAPAPPPSAGVVPRQTHPGYGNATSTAATPPPATPSAAASGANGAAPALRPSVATSQNEAIYGTQALPGATILTPGSFSSSVQ